MTTRESEFQNWFVESLAPLRNCGNAGFIFLLVAFPLLERYLRRKSSCPEGQTLTDAFFKNLQTLFPELSGRERPFWNCYRDGLLHHVTFPRAKLSKKTNTWTPLPEAAMSGHDPRPVYFSDATGTFYVNPVAFFDVVTNKILSDFATYETGDTTYYPLVSTLDPTGATPGIVPTINFNLPPASPVSPSGREKKA
jgi:hypothetical protein